MQYNLFFLDDKKQDIEKFIKPFEFKSLDTENQNKNFAFIKPKGDYVIFGLYKENFISKASKKNLIILEEEYNIQNKLLSHYENVIFHAILKNKELYIFCVVNIDTEVCLGIYETSNLISMLGFKFVNVVHENVYSYKNLENLIITQRNEANFENKVFMLTEKI